MLEGIVLWFIVSTMVMIATELVALKHAKVIENRPWKSALKRDLRESWGIILVSWIIAWPITVPVLLYSCNKDFKILREEQE